MTEGLRLWLEGTVGEVMNPSFVSIHEDEGLERLVELFKVHRFHGFPVLDNEGKVVGIVRDGEMLSVFARREATTTHLRRVGDIMRTPAPMVDHRETIQHAITKTFSDNTRFLVVVDPERRILGVVTRIDLMKGIRWELEGAEGNGR
ncbi:MAG: CBS domain-containing protein [Candidatus Geothermincolia bacterium]